MKTSIILTAVASLLFFAGCKKEEVPNPNNPTSKVGDNPLSAPADYVGTINKAQQSAVRSLNTSSIDQAIKMFQQEEGRNPKSLEELVTSGTLPKLPELPANMKFEYDAETGRARVVKK